NAFQNITLTNGTSTTFAVTGITSALPLAAADGSLSEYAGTSCTDQFVRSLNGAGVAACASVQDEDLNLTDITLADFTNDADYVKWASATSSLWQSTGLLSTASSTIGAGGQTTGLTISGGATTTGNAYFAGNVGIGSSTPSSALSISGDIAFSAGANRTISVLPVAGDGNNLTISAASAMTGGNWNGGYLNLNAGAGNGAGEGGNVVVTAGSTNGNGGAGIITLTAGNAGTQNHDGGTITLNGGTKAGTGVDGNILLATLRGNVGVGTTSPFAKLSVFAGGDYAASAASTLFAVGSTTAGTATTTLFSINSAGALTASGAVTLSNYTSGALAADATGLLYTFSTSTWSFASSTLLANTNTWTGTNAFQNITLTNGTSTTFAVTGITSALPLAAADGSLSEYAGTSCTDQFVRSLNGAGVAACASVQDEDLNLTDITLADFTNDADYVKWANATSSLWQSTGLLSTASSTIGNGAQAGGLTISGGATTTGNQLISGSLTAGATALSSLTLTTDLAVAEGGTGLSTWGGTNTLLYTTAADTLASEAAFTYDPTANRLTFDYASSTALTVSGTASTTDLIVSSAGGTAGCATFSSVGLLSNTGTACGSGSGTFSWTPTTSFGTAANSTSTLLLLTNGLSASSTIRFGNAGISPFIFDGTTGNLSLGTTTQTSNAKLDIYGDTILSGNNRYLNFGTTTSSNGYGFRDNAGTLEFKNSGGVWNSVNTATSGPAFRVHKNGTDQTNIGSSPTLITWATEEFDTNNNFDLTNDRFQPTVPGKYILTAQVYYSSLDADDDGFSAIYKNGIEYARVRLPSETTEASAFGVTVTTIVDANGTTDYFEVYGDTSVTGNETVAGQDYLTFFSGAMIAPVYAGAGGGWTNNGTSSYLIDNADLVGIGTTTPSAKLDIYGTAGSSDIFAISSSTNERLLTVAANGNVGIGTTSPEARLHADVGAGSTATIGGLVYGSTASGAITSLGAGATQQKATLMVGSNWNNTNSSGAGLLNVFNSVDSKFWVGNTGNVGIGTTTPGADVSMTGGLTIDGTGSTHFTVANSGVTGFALNVSGGSWTMYDKTGGTYHSTITSDSGNVGIGDASPASLFTVGSGDLFQVSSAGTVRIDHSASTADVWIQGGSGSSGDTRNLALYGQETNDDLILNYNTEYDCVSVGGTSCTESLD
ncbi:hypothetical protein HY418_02745, partial [Candidatus Kaiserbacteria bacterium]|nr:hypothetical protein [Candidatus Kaiserbacteria bacterium]